MTKEKASFSGKQITKAGQFLAKGDYEDRECFDRYFDILVYWRSEHSHSLETALELLQKTVAPIEKDALFAKRLKRYVSIVLKLQRFDQMMLKKMQDIGGCRAVVANEKKVRKIVRELKKNSAFKYPNGKFRTKDYIASPKDDGYRSFHIIGQFNSIEKSPRNIEIQIRTYLQHYWATALEIIDLFTNQSLKTNQGKKEWEDFFRLVSELFAVLDKVPNYHNLDIDDQLKGFLNGATRLGMDVGSKLNRLSKVLKKLDVAKLFSSFANSLKIVGDELQNNEEAGYTLLVIDPDNGQLEYTIFNKNDSDIALERYASQESLATSSTNNLIVALVYTSSIEDVKEAYPNFFGDSTMFIRNLGVLKEADRIIREEFIRRSLKRFF